MPAESPEEISLNVGESTEVKLKGLGTAGYKWNYSIQNNAEISALALMKFLL
jgi:predicted secreted protein